MARKVKKYEVEVDERKARVTVPERHEMCAYSGELKDILRDVLRDNLSPEAVAAIAACIGPRAVAFTTVELKAPKVAREVKWFRELLVGMVGCEYERIRKELGL